jgi:transposase
MTKTYTRCAKSSLKFTNQKKKNTLVSIHNEYIKIMQDIINMEFNKNDHNFTSYISRQTEDKIKETTWLSKRMIQAAGKQAMAVLKGTSAKQNKRKYILDNMSPNDPNYQKLLDAIYKNQYSCPVISKDTPMVLDSRMVSFEDKSGEFSWITLSSIGEKIKLHLPVKTTSHMKKMVTNGGNMNKTITISPKEASFSYDFEYEEPDTTTGKTLGIDIGIKSLITASDGQTEHPCIHGHTMESIMNVMVRKKKGSKAFKRKQTQRKQHINWVINKLNLNDVTKVICENIKDMRRGVNHGRIMSSWAYPMIFAKLKRKCEEKNVSISFISPTYTSKRCSNCGWTKDGNRNGLEFSCDSCGNTMNADLNAAINIASGIKPIRFDSRKLQDIRTGFFWNVIYQESIVPDSKKSNII